ncbi:LOW QUALITY PROTEIN: uncharacterized protein C20orf173 homolog [Microtus oregoni]|uniref:LOW QUALITY PROTEIN: uncharacterized protein C20orf173 homolog n=1 Tax=Microtus oregoni TaxID=111838 RepID=UPI001BB139CA|nr:LOW QUALITY PROTEIN: uncharacterized protein C20orf173 homolog [Microtus oregoni]
MGTARKGDTSRPAPLASRFRPGVWATPLAVSRRRGSAYEGATLTRLLTGCVASLVWASHGVLWLRAPYLDWTHETAPQQEWTYMVPRHCNWLCFKFGEHGCPSRTPNCPTCHHTVGGWTCFEACYEKTVGYLRDQALWWLDMSSVSELGKVWKELLEVIPRPLVHLFDFLCVPCVMLATLAAAVSTWISVVTKKVVGQVRLAPGSVSFCLVPRISQGTTRSSEEGVRSQTPGPFTCPRNTRVLGGSRGSQSLLIWCTRW